MKVVLAGATGLVGSIVLNELLEKVSLEVITLTRRPLSPSPNHHNILIDWKQWHPVDLDADIFICCLGTTIKSAGSKEAFKEVDYSYIKKFAEAAALSRAKRFILISANGAHPDSAFFYNRVKGETELMLQDFRIPNTAILRPSLLIGDRTEKRPAEKVAQALFPKINPFLLGPLKKYQSIKATKVAADILWLVENDWKGLKIIESDQLNATPFSV